MSVMNISTKGNAEQGELVRLIMEKNKPIIIATGNAGTGKTFISLASALELVLREKKYSKIIYGRNPVQVGEELGFLPGDINEKYGPFMAPLYDNLESIAKFGATRVVEAKSKIECTPIAFLRGRNLDDAIVIIDECQNLDITALRTILTRMGEHSKIILLGSMNQIDARKQNKICCDFEKVIVKLRELDIVGIVQLEKSMRSEWCTMIDDLLGEIN